MLNTCLNHNYFSEYTDLLTHILTHSRLHSILDGTVGKHLKQHASEIQIDHSSTLWKLVSSLIPEILDPHLRSDLLYYKMLPDWANLSEPSMYHG